MKFNVFIGLIGAYLRRSPHGERGLKLVFELGYSVLWTSLPAWGARIEIRASEDRAGAAESLPAWGARIEIVYPVGSIYMSTVVAPRMGSAD